MNQDTKAQFGVVGMAVMGRNLALNVEDKGFSVALFNRSFDKTKEVLAGNRGKRLLGAQSAAELVRWIERPRRILMMVKAGAPTDDTIEQLLPLLEPGDVLIDGGNTWFEDTERREKSLRERGVHFIGCGISGGEEGARHGPSLMPGGTREAYECVRPVFEKIAAKSASGACVTYVGAGGAGHFVKMVHNGIEYGDMQLIAEAYHVLREGLGFDNDELAQVFEEWNKGELESFLIELSQGIFRARDQESGRHLLDLVLDQAEQKGTGRWTVELAVREGIGVPTIAAAVDARVMSSKKNERVAASKLLGGPELSGLAGDPKEWAHDVQGALYASKICAYAQGLDLIRSMSSRLGWNVDLSEMARIWTGGCIIRARLLSVIHQAWRKDAALANLMLDPAFRDSLTRAQRPWRRVVSGAVSVGIPVPAMAASLGYYDSYRCKSLPQNLTQAQRDAFGAHTFVRVDRPQSGPVHADWK